MPDETEELSNREDSELEIRTDVLGSERIITARLRAPADYCFQTFCDVDLIPKWLWVVDTAVVHQRDERNRAVRVDFIGALERASVGYGLAYSYDDPRRQVRWHLTGRGVDRLAGWARFRDTPQESCLLEYHLDTALARGLPPWADRLYQAEPAETVVADFCEFVLQRLRA